MNKVSYSPVTVRSICKVQSARIECTERDRVQYKALYSTVHCSTMVIKMKQSLSLPRDNPYMINAFYMHSTVQLVIKMEQLLSLPP